MRTFAMVVVVVVGVVGHAAVAGADVVEMTDGRRFEGEIVRQDETSVSIDTRVTATIRTTLRLDRSEIESIERKPLPEGFFDPPPAPPRLSDPQKDSPQDTLYLEVPIVGEFGRDVFADGVSKALRYAKRYRILHVVFVIDSEGGDLEDIEATYTLLRNNRRVLTYHAVVRNCTGGALAIPVWCDSMHLLPGARLGGSERPLSASSRMSDEDQILRAQIARGVVRETGLEGTVGDVVRAMIDPAVVLAAWRDEGGEIQVASAPPAGLPAERLVFRVGGGQVLVLSDRQAVELGAESFAGDIESLGAVLGFSHWKEESDYGRRAMEEAAAQKKRDAAQVQAKYAEAVEENIRKRGIAERYLEESVQRAAEWNPNDASYDYYVRRRGWGWRGSKIRMTYDSRVRWQQLSDTAIGYLREAARAVTTIERLDRQAIELDLEPTFRPDELVWIKEDIQTKYNYFAANQDRRR